ncbi:hypothetical protein MKW94_007588 [Papaver nudicaule]|uniref:Peptidase M48 domain-containing protein n=1 Tax=Papaver nudicaule TaxID=74823 RepID=A0AA41VR53_PAPNU|nr:hypothetical protein [Papaver nudicaule]
MSSLRKARLAIDTIRKLGSRILTRSSRKPVREANHQLKQRCASVNSPSSNSISRVSCNSGYSLRSKFNSFHLFGKQNHRAHPSNLNGARRFYHSYHAHQNQISHTHHFRRNPRSLRNNLITVLVIGGVVITVWGLERIPYSKRNHVVFVSKDFERKVGEIYFEVVKKIYEGKILTEPHPKAVRARLIANDIVVALLRGLNDDKRVQESSKKGSEVAIYHLEGLKWEIMVVNEPELVNAFCLPGGKIVVFTGLIDFFKKDAEIATIIAHEVGHIVARHGAENISHCICFLILKMIQILFAPRTNMNYAYEYLFKLPFSRRREKEADYIGLLLLAKAGYDPRVAPQVFEKLGELTGEWLLEDYVSTHPSGKERARLLSQDKVMEEALGIYKESKKKEESGFFWESCIILYLVTSLSILMMTW